MSSFRSAWRRDFLALVSCLAWVYETQNLPSFSSAPTSEKSWICAYLPSVGFLSEIQGHNQACSVDVKMKMCYNPAGTCLKSGTEKAHSAVWRDLIIHMHVHIYSHANTACRKRTKVSFKHLLTLCLTCVNSNHWKFLEGHTVLLMSLFFS